MLPTRKQAIVENNFLYCLQGPLWMPHPAMYGMSSKATVFFHAIQSSWHRHWHEMILGSGWRGWMWWWWWWRRGGDAKPGISLQNRQQGWRTTYRRDILWNADKDSGGQLFTQRPNFPVTYKKKFFLSVCLSISCCLPHLEQELKRGDINLIERKKKKMASRLALVLDTSASTGPSSVATTALHILVEFSNRQLPAVARIQRAWYL